MSTLFISHSSHDNEAAGEVASRLESEGHRSLFLDFDEAKGIAGGAGWEQALYTNLRACRAVIVVATDSWIDSKWCFAEVALARMEGKSIFVLRMGGKQDLPSILTADQAIDMTRKPEEGYRRLWHGFREKGIVAAEHSRWGPEDPPYPGLRAFTEKDEPIFFGRDAETLEGLELLNSIRRQGQGRLVMVLGASGSGKSSLARAALVPRLRRDSEQWVVVGSLRPGRDPLRALAAAFAKAFENRSFEDLLAQLDPEAEVGEESPEPDTESESDTESKSESEENTAADPPARERLLAALADFEALHDAEDVALAESLDGLRELLAAAPAPRADDAAGAGEPAAIDFENPVARIAAQLLHERGRPDASVVLVVDQFEEALGRDAEGDGRTAAIFLRLVNEAVREAGSRLLVLATMRSDHLDAFQKAPALEGVRFKSLSLGPMSKDGMREVIENPARLGRIALEERLPDLLLDDTATSDALPLLAFTLRVLWDRCRERGRFAIADYRELRGLQGAVALVADETLEAALEAGDEATLRDAFLRLARPSEEGSSWVRQPVQWDEFKTAVQPMLQRFIDMRLLIKRQDGTVEVAHEALFRSWETLRSWLRANAEGLYLLREIRGDATKWSEAEKDAEKEPYLWRGGRLTRALELRAGGALPLEDVDRAFIEAAEQAERAREEEIEAQHRRELEHARRLQESFAASLLEQGRSELLSGSPLRAAIYLSASYSIRSDSASLRMLLARSLRLLPKATLSGHTERVKTALFDPAGERVVTAAGDRTAKLWDAATGELLVTLEGHSDRLVSASFDLAGKRVLTGSRDGTGKLWNATTGELLVTLEGHSEAVHSAAFDPTFQRVVTASADDSAKVWDASSGEMLMSLDSHATDVVAAAFGPFGQNIVTVSEDGTALVWNVASGEIEHTLQGHSGAIHSLAFDAQGRRLVTASYDHSAKIWDLETGKVVHSLEGHGAQVVAAVFDPTGERIITASHDRTAKIWDAGSGEVLFELEGHSGRLTDARFDPAGELVVTTATDHSARVWNAGTGELMADLAGHGDLVQQATFDPSGSRILTASFDRTARIWDTGFGSLSIAFEGHEGWVRSAHFDAAGDRILTAGDDRTARVWDAESGRQLVAFEGHEDALKSARFAPDGHSIVTAGADGVARIWGRAEDAEILALEGHGAPLESATFSTDGKRILTASNDGSARIWDSGSGELVATLGGHEGSVVAAGFDPTGERVVTSSLDHTARVWQTDSGELLATLEGHSDAVVAAEFDPAGERIVTASLDQTARIWTAAGEVVAVIEGHTGWVKTAQFDPSGSLIVTASLDHTAKIWNAASGQLEVSIEGHTAPVNTAAFDPTGERVVTASDDGTGRVWDARSGTSIATLDWHEAQVLTAEFDAGGERILTASSDQTARVWKVSLEHRTPEEVAAVVAESIPYELVDGRVVPRTARPAPEPG